MALVDSAKASKLMIKGQAEPAMKDGVLYGLPLTIEEFGLIYNRDLFQKAKVDPKNIKSMDDLIKAYKSLEKVDGVQKNPTLYSCIHSTGFCSNEKLQ